MTQPLYWISIVAPPYEPGSARLVITRPKEGEEDGTVLARAALLAFPNVLICALSIKGYQLYDDVIVPEEMLDRPLSGLDVTNAQRIVSAQLPDHQTLN